MGFLSKTKLKAYTKLTVVMRYQIVDRKSISPSSGNVGSDQRRGTPVDKITFKLLIKSLLYKITFKLLIQKIKQLHGFFNI